MSGKLHLVPALLDEVYIIRFAVVSEHARSEDMEYAWNVISDTATEVIAEIDRNKTRERKISHIASFQVTKLLFVTMILIMIIIVYALALFLYWPQQLIITAAKAELYFPLQSKTKSKVWVKLSH